MQSQSQLIKIKSDLYVIMLSYILVTGFTFALYLFFADCSILGIGDDFDDLGELHEVSVDFYMKTSPRWTMLLTRDAMARIVSYMGLTPFTFPWMIGFFLSYLLFNLTVVNTLLALKTILRMDAMLYSCMLICYLGIMSLCPEFLNDLFQIFIFMLHYTLPPLLLSALFLICAFTRNRTWKYRWINPCLIVYTYVIFTLETFPVIGIGMITLFLFFGLLQDGKPTIPQTVTYGLVYALSFFAIGVYLFTPGAKSRLSSVSMGHEKSINLHRWIDYFLRYTEEMLLIPRTLIILVSAYLISRLIYMIIQSIRQKRLSLMRTEEFTKLYWATGLIGLGLGACATTIFVEFFPERAFLMPGLFIAAGLLIFLEHMISNWCRKLHQTNKTQCLCGLVVISLLFLGYRMPAAIQRIAKNIAINELRYHTYMDIVQRQRIAQDKHVKYFLNNAPETLDAFWGINAFLNWLETSGLPHNFEIRSVAIGTPNWPYDMRDVSKDHVDIACHETLPKLLCKQTTSNKLEPVRSRIGLKRDQFHEPSKRGKSAFAYIDFPLYADLDCFDVAIAYNPLIGGHQHYKDIQHFKLLIGREWDPLKKTVVCRLHSAQNATTQNPYNIKIGFSFVGKNGQETTPVYSKLPKTSDSVIIDRISCFPCFLRIKFEDVVPLNLMYFLSGVTVELKPKA